MRSARQGETSGYSTSRRRKEFAGMTDACAESGLASSLVDGYRQHNRRGRVLRPIHLLRCHGVVGIGSLVDVVHKLLRIAVIQRKPRTLHLHHDAVSLEKDMVVGM